MKLSIREVAVIFGISENQVQRWIREDHLPALLVNGQHRLNSSEVLEWATTRRMNVPPALFGNGHADLFGLLRNALRRGGVLPLVPGEDKASVLQAAVQRMPGLSETERTELLSLIESREHAGTSAVGGGIAMPHPARPFVVARAEPSVTLCYLQRPVDFGAADHQPVHSLFVVLSTNVRNHLTLLAELASALHDSAFRQAISDHAPEAEIMTLLARLAPVAA